MNTIIETKNRLLEWVSENSKTTQHADLGFDTNIIEKRILSSIQLMDLILYMEHLRGEPVDIRRIGVGAFTSINAIYETFFQTGEA